MIKYTFIDTTFDGIETVYMKSPEFILIQMYYI